MDLKGIVLNYATAQPICHLDENAITSSLKMTASPPSSASRPKTLQKYRPAKDK
jgi:hypothetical protein